MQQDIPESVKIWIWIHVPMVLPNPWPLLWISPYFRGLGRKGPFASLYKYCNQMPDYIYYDFAC